MTKGGGGAFGGAPGDSMKTFKQEPKSKVIQRDVVIDDFIRNFFSKF